MLGLSDSEGDDMGTGICVIRGRVPALAALAFATYLSGCNILTDSNDPCDDTIAPQVHVNVTYKVQVFMYTTEMTQVPISGCILDISVWKQLCEGGRKGQMDFPDSHTGASNEYQLTVGYNLHNTKDRIGIKVESLCDGLSYEATDESEVFIGYDEAAGAGGALTRVVKMFHDEIEIWD